MLTRNLLLPLVLFIATTGVAHAESSRLKILSPASQLDQQFPLATPIAPDPTPLPTIAPTPLPTAAPTPLPTAAPTPNPTPNPTPVSTPPPVTSTPAPTQTPVLSLPPTTPTNVVSSTGSRSDVAVTTPATSQLVQQAAQAITASPAEQQRVLMNVPFHIASSTFSEPNSDYSYGSFSGLNRNLTLGLDSLAALLALSGIYVAVRSGSTMHV